MHILKNLHAQLIALHYMNGFYPKFSRRLLHDMLSYSVSHPEFDTPYTCHLLRRQAAFKAPLASQLSGDRKIRTWLLFSNTLNKTKTRSGKPSKLEHCKTWGKFPTRGVKICPNVPKFTKLLTWSRSQFFLALFYTHEQIQEETVEKLVF